MIDWLKRKGVPLQWSFTGPELELCDQASLDHNSNHRHDDHHLGITRIQFVIGSFVAASGVTLKPANGGQGKTGQRK